MTHADWVARNPLRAYRAAQGLSQFAVAVQLGASPTAIANYEHGRQTPRRDVMVRIGRLLRPTDVPLPQARHDILSAWTAWREQRPKEEE